MSNMTHERKILVTGLGITAVIVIAIGTSLGISMLALHRSHGLDRGTVHRIDATSVIAAQEAHEAAVWANYLAGKEKAQSAYDVETSGKLGGIELEQKQQAKINRALLHRLEVIEKQQSAASERAK
jgi:hypothetical protein